MEEIGGYNQFRLYQVESPELQGCIQTVINKKEKREGKFFLSDLNRPKEKIFSRPEPPSRAKVLFLGRVRLLNTPCVIVHTLRDIVRTPSVIAHTLHLGITGWGKWGNRMLMRNFGAIFWSEKKGRFNWRWLHFGKNRIAYPLILSITNMRCYLSIRLRLVAS